MITLAIAAVSGLLGALIGWVLAAPARPPGDRIVIYAHTVTSQDSTQ